MALEDGPQHTETAEQFVNTTTQETATAESQEIQANTPEQAPSQKEMDVARGREMFSNGVNRVKGILGGVFNRLKSTGNRISSLGRSTADFALGTLGATGRNAENVSNYVTTKSAELAGKTVRAYENLNAKIDTAKQQFGNKVDTLKREYVLKTHDKAIDKRHLGNLQEAMDAMESFSAQDFRNEQLAVLRTRQNEAFKSGVGIGEAAQAIVDFENNWGDQAAEIYDGLCTEVERLQKRYETLRRRFGHAVQDREPLSNQPETATA